jgi:hypothetical protein
MVEEMTYLLLGRILYDKKYKVHLKYEKSPGTDFSTFQSVILNGMWGKVKYEIYNYDYRKEFKQKK